MIISSKILIDILKSFNNSTIEIIEDGSILTEDLLNVIDLNYFNLDKNLDLYEHLKIIAIAETSPLLKDKCFESDIIYLYFLLDEKLGDIYIGIDYIHPFFWNKIHVESEEELRKEILKHINIYCTDIFYDNLDCDEKFSKTVKGFVGTEKMLNLKFDEIENFIVENKFCEYFIWGSFWNDFPYRSHVLDKNLKRFQLERMLAHSMKQRNNFISLSTRTKASKSILTFEYINGAFILNIKYNSVKNNSIKIFNELTTNFLPNDIPLDVIGAICVFNFINYKQLLQEPIKIENIALSTELISNDISYENLISELEYIHQNIEIDEPTKQYIFKTKIILKVNRKINLIDHIKMLNEISDLLNEKEVDSKDIYMTVKKWLIKKINMNEILGEDETELGETHLLELGKKYIENILKR